MNLVQRISIIEKRIAATEDRILRLEARRCPGPDLALRDQVEALAARPPMVERILVEQKPMTWLDRLFRGWGK